MTEKIASRRLLAFTDSRVFKWATVAATTFALIGFPLTFPPVQNFLFGKRTELTLERLSEIPLVDITRPLGGLKVEFQGQDLMALRQGVVASQVQIRNTGDESITPAKMTAVDPIGFQVDGGTVVRVNRTMASSEHLRRYAVVTRTGNRITLSPQVIFDPGDYVRFDLLITRPLDGNVRYRPVGKVEDVKAIGFRDVLTQGDEGGFLERAFGGNGFVQLARLGAYAIAGLLLVILLVVALIQRDEWRTSRKAKRRKRLASDVLAEIGPGPKGVQEMAADVYKLNGLRMLRFLEGRLRRPFTSSDVRPDAPATLESFMAEGPEGSEVIFRRFAHTEAVRSLAIRLREAKLLNPKNGAASKSVELGFIAFREALERRAAVDGVDLESLETGPKFVTDVDTIGASRISFDQGE